MDLNTGKDGNRRPALEWVVGVVSATAVCGIIAFLGYEALLGDTRPPNLIASIVRMEQVEGGKLVVTTVSNLGDQAAADVTVEATWEGAGSVPTRKEIHFDYVASHAVRRGAFLMEEPAADVKNVRLIIHGYVYP
jgi:uncharacterized protein (TIGR02588 family)